MKKMGRISILNDIAKSSVWTEPKTYLQYGYRFQMAFTKFEALFILKSGKARIKFSILCLFSINVLFDALTCESNVRLSLRLLKLTLKLTLSKFGAVIANFRWPWSKIAMVILKPFGVRGYKTYRMSVAYTSDIFRRGAVLHSEGRFIDQLTRHLKAGIRRGLNKKRAFHFKMKTFPPDYWIDNFEAVGVRWNSPNERDKHGPQKTQWLSIHFFRGRVGIGGIGQSSSLFCEKVSLWPISLICIFYWRDLSLSSL